MVQNMEDKVMATGKIVPREEIEIKPNMSGIVDKVLVDEGDRVTVGQLIATIRIVPNSQIVNASKQEINGAHLKIIKPQLNLDNQQKQSGRKKRMLNEVVISQQDYSD